MEAIECIKSRRSCKKYKAEQITAEQLDTILECGMNAPTGKNGQSPIIVVIQDADKIREVEKLNAAAMGNPDGSPFYGAPTLLIVFGDSEIPFCEADANLVMGNLLNAATAIGVDSCYIWRANKVFATDEGKALMKKWGIPDNYVGCGNVILGYGEEGSKKDPSPRKEGYIVRV